MLSLISHGGLEGVTGSCHELGYAPGKSLLVDCGDTVIASVAKPTKSARNVVEPESQAEHA